MRISGHMKRQGLTSALPQECLSREHTLEVRASFDGLSTRRVLRPYPENAGNLGGSIRAPEQPLHTYPGQIGYIFKKCTAHSVESIVRRNIRRNHLILYAVHVRPMLSGVIVQDVDHSYLSSRRQLPVQSAFSTPVPSVPTCRHTPEFSAHWYPRHPGFRIAQYSTLHPTIHQARGSLPPSVRQPPYHDDTRERQVSTTEVVPRRSEQTVRREKNAEITKSTATVRLGRGNRRLRFVFRAFESTKTTYQLSCFARGH